MKDVCSLLGTEKLNTTAYHPQCNGLVERFNRTLKMMLRKHAGKFGLQWDRYLHGVLWAYRNTPHDSTNEKPSFLLFGTDCRYPTEAALLPPSPLEAADVEDYREELVLTLSSARQLAAEAIQKAQVKYKKAYDCNSRVRDLRIGDWVLIRFPQEETGANRKLSRPWHGPYRVVDSDVTGVTAVKVYASQEDPIHVHQSRVTRCPPGFPAGYWWYGNRQSSPGRPPKWVDRYLAAQDTHSGDVADSLPESASTECQTDSTRSDDIVSDEASDSTESGAEHVSERDSSEQDPCSLEGESAGHHSMAMTPEDQASEPGRTGSSSLTRDERLQHSLPPSADQRSKQRGRAKGQLRAQSPKATRTRTRVIAPPERLMMVRSGRAI